MPYMNLSPTMRVFDTVINTDFGGVEETGILLTIPDIYPEKNSVICVGRGGVKTSSSAGNISASPAGASLAYREKMGSVVEPDFPGSDLILIKLRLFGVIFLFMDAEFLEKL